MIYNIEQTNKNMMKYNNIHELSIISYIGNHSMKLNDMFPFS